MSDTVSIDPEALTIDDNQELVAFVIRQQMCLCPEVVANIRDAMKMAFRYTKWADIPVLVLEDGMTLELVRWPPQDVKQASETEGE